VGAAPLLHVRRTFPSSPPRLSRVPSPGAGAHSGDGVGNARAVDAAVDRALAGHARVVGEPVRLLVAPPLRFLLPGRSRHGTVDVPYDATASLGHVVQAAGVPLPEVGALRVRGRAVSARHRPAPGAEVEVLPRERPQPLDGPPRLLLDVHLGTLARRLRLLGVDAAYRNDADDDTLVRWSLEEDRLLLTQDRGLLRRRALRRAAYVRGRSAQEQLDDVLDRFRLPLAPWTRCTACGAPVEPVDKAQVDARLEPGTRRTHHRFGRCTSCGRVYWRGAHAARLDAVVARAASRERSLERSGEHERFAPPTAR
jgi:uncharacterized protein with PIN domain